jgi:hypothetical protein
MSGKSGGSVGGLTDGGSGWGLSSSGLGMALVLEDMRLTRVDLVCSRGLLSAANAAGTYRGRPEDTASNAGIAGMLRSGMS